MLASKIFNHHSSEEFTALALDVFRYQHQNVPVYRAFCEFLKTDPSSIQSIEKIPFLPIQLYKEQKVISEGHSAQKTFTSSGTTGNITSKHHVVDLELYIHSFTKAFQLFFGPICDYTILALLPSYQKREGSSLIYMADTLIKESKNSDSGFFLNQTETLTECLLHLESTGKKTLLLGVSYALLDLIEHHKFELSNTIVMETGGMKGRRKEMIKEDLHTRLKHGFRVKSIYSEYGMTELLSQAYSKGNGVFFCPPWMKVMTRDPEDALSWIQGKTGGINVIDLANIYSCSFIATQDLGKVQNDGSFEIIGRFDTSDIRGCNLMVL